MYELTPDFTPKYILSKVSQEEIFEYYTGESVVVGEFFCSPLRNDSHPTCNYSYYNGKLWYRDWADTKPMDCFTMVMYLYNCTFHEALRIIKRDLIDGFDRQRRDISGIAFQSDHSKRDKVPIKVVLKQPCKLTLSYLKSYCLTTEVCKRFNVYPVQTVWFGSRMLYKFRPDDPALGYYFGKNEQGEQRWKIYFFNRSRKHAVRFITNTNRIAGWIQIPDKGKYLVITKSLKDVMCLSLFDIPAVAMQNETTVPYDYIIKELQERYDSLYSLYDFDRTGVRLANILKKQYGIPPLFLTNGRFKTHNYGFKDFSDYLQGKGFNETKVLVDATISQFEILS